MVCEHKYESESLRIWITEPGTDRAELNVSVLTISCNPEKWGKPRAFSSIPVEHCPLCGMFVGQWPPDYEPTDPGRCAFPSCNYAGTVHVQVAEETWGVCPPHSRELIKFLKEVRS